jgi:hypothetical protein
MPVIPAIQEAWIGTLRSDAGSRQKYETLSEKQLNQKGLQVWLKVVEHQPSKYMALSSNSNTIKRQKKKKKKKNKQRLNCWDWLKKLGQLNC